MDANHSLLNESPVCNPLCHDGLLQWCTTTTLHLYHQPLKLMN